MRKKKGKLKCSYCDNHATHSIMMELRDKPGPPIKENNVLNVACDIHSIETTFDYYVPLWAFKKLCVDWKQQAGIILDKKYCTIQIVKFK